MRKFSLKLIDRWRHRIYNKKGNQKELDEICEMIEREFYGY